MSKFGESLDAAIKSKRTQNHRASRSAIAANTSSQQLGVRRRELQPVVAQILVKDLVEAVHILKVHGIAPNVTLVEQEITEKQVSVGGLKGLIGHRRSVTEIVDAPIARAWTLTGETRYSTRDLGYRGWGGNEYGAFRHVRGLAVTEDQLVYQYENSNQVESTIDEYNTLQSKYRNVTWSRSTDISMVGSVLGRPANDEDIAPASELLASPAAEAQPFIETMRQQIASMTAKLA